MHRLEELLGKAREALLSEEDLDDGLERAVAVLVDGGLVGQDQQAAARRALEQATGMTAWRCRRVALTQAEGYLDTAGALLEDIGESDLAERVAAVLREVEDLTPDGGDMPPDEVVGLRSLVETFPSVLLESLLAPGRLAEAAG